jgi:RNA 2',3'-cyclic 3'-phosphodiesterase
MRTFIAVPLPEDVRAGLNEIQAKLREFRADVRWTAIPSIHLTLKFLGEIDPATLPGLARGLREATRADAPFELALHNLGGFPDLRRPRVLWCGLSGDLEILASLQRAVESACTTAGLAAEDRAFQPHLTLGRVQGKSNLQPLLDYITISGISVHTFRVREYALYRSTLRPHGAVYTVLEKFSLMGEGRHET